MDIGTAGKPMPKSSTLVGPDLAGLLGLIFFPLDSYSKKQTAHRADICRSRQGRRRWRWQAAIHGRRQPRLPPQSPFRARMLAGCPRSSRRKRGEERSGEDFWAPEIEECQTDGVTDGRLLDRPGNSWTHLASPKPKSKPNIQTVFPLLPRDSPTGW